MTGAYKGQRAGNGACWTMEQDNTLRMMRAEGASASEIASVLGMTRNAVLGRANRLGMKKLTTKPKNTKPRSRRVPKPLVTSMRLDLPRLPLPPQEDISYAEPKLLELIDLEEHHCRWPYGDRGNFRFCGHDKEHGPYCARHARKGLTIYSKG